MKKTFAILSLVAFAAISLSSCKKDYTCECVFTNGTGNMSLPLVNYKKGDAEDACKTAQGTYVNADPNVKCTLK